jgi:hypothetical protein
MTFSKEKPIEMALEREIEEFLINDLLNISINP